MECHVSIEDYNVIILGGFIYPDEFVTREWTRHSTDARDCKGFYRTLSHIFPQVYCINSSMFETKILEPSKKNFFKPTLVDNEFLAYNLRSVRKPLLWSLTNLISIIRLLLHLSKQNPNLIVVTMKQEWEYLFGLRLAQFFRPLIISIPWLTYSIIFPYFHWATRDIANTLIKLSVSTVRGVILSRPEYGCGLFEGLPTYRYVYPVDKSKLAKLNISVPRNSKGFKICYGGAMNYSQRIDLMLRIARESSSDIEWNFAGLGPYVSEVQDFVRSERERERERVNYLGYLSYDEYLNLLKESNLFLFLRNYSKQPSGEDLSSNFSASKTTAKNKFTRSMDASKLNDILLVGIPVLCNYFPGIYEQALPYINLIPNSDFEDLFVRNALIEIRKIRDGYSTSLKKAQNGRKFWLNLSDFDKVVNSMKIFFQTVIQAENR
jgi:hypothetical protein